MELSLGNFKVKPVTETTQRLNMLIWGASGCGKTTLATTAPGKKLWILFDPDGQTSILEVQNRDDCHVLDLSNENCNVVAQLAAENCMNLEKFIVDNNFDTIVFDSMTTYLTKCLQLAVTSVKNATEMTPTLQGYGNRKYFLEKTIKNLLKITGKLNKHLILLAHEDKPALNNDGAIESIEPLLGGQSSTTMPILISEVWHLSNNGKEYRIRVKANIVRKPMKTRMFDESVSDFVWNYTPKTGGNGIKEWFDKWVQEKQKIKPF